jgi:hypothetical protein
MVVSQSPAGHEKITRLLATLRQARRQVAEGKGEARLAVLDAEEDAEANAEVRAKLRRAVSVAWLGKVLREAVNELRDKHGLPIEVDQKNLADANVTLDTPVNLKLSRVSLRTVLDQLTVPLGASWRIVDGIVLITSKEQVDAYLTPRIYPAPDLLARDAADDDQSLVGVIVNTVQRDSWSDAGGPGNILTCDGLGCLICIQTRPRHEEIESLLASLRRDIAASPAVPRTTGEMTLQVYRIADPTLAAGAGTPRPVGGSSGQPPSAAPAGTATPKTHGHADAPSAEAVAKVVRDLVAPESWDAPGTKAYLRALGDRIIVRQTPKVHREIRALLEKLGVTPTADPAGSGRGGGFF